MHWIFFLLIFKGLRIVWHESSVLQVINKHLRGSLDIFGRFSYRFDCDQLLQWLFLRENLRGIRNNVADRVAFSRGEGVDWPRLRLFNLALDPFLYNFCLLRCLHQDSFLSLYRSEGVRWWLFVHYWISWSLVDTQEIFSWNALWSFFGWAVSRLFLRPFIIFFLLILIREGRDCLFGRSLRDHIEWCMMGIVVKAWRQIFLKWRKHHIHIV